MKPTSSIDSVYFALVVALVAIGMFMMLSTSSVIGLSNYQDSYYFIKRHLIYLIMGGTGLVLAMALPFEFIKKHSMNGYIGAVMLVSATLIPGIGVSIGGASRWLHTGIINIQPVEVMKLFLILVLAQILAKKQQHRDCFKQFMLPCLVVLVAAVVPLLLQPDLGNTILMGAIFMVLVFLAQAPLRHLLSLIGVGSVFLAGYIISHPYQLKRIQTFLFPSDDPLGRSYHVLQSFTAIGSGGLTGLGLGQSKLKYFYIPFHYSDFIYSIICEEGGFILGGVVIALFVGIFMRGMTIARAQPDNVRRFTVIGLNLCLVFQALVNIAVVIGVLPVTGIPLTFISFGGTSLMMSLFFVGIILNLSKAKE